MMRAVVPWLAIAMYLVIQFALMVAFLTVLPDYIALPAGVFVAIFFLGALLAMMRRWFGYDYRAKW